MASIDELEPRLVALEEFMKEVQSALLGSLDGKKGLCSQVDSLIELQKSTMEMTQRNATQLDAMRLDKAKITGIVIAVGAIATAVGKFLLH